MARPKEIDYERAVRRMKIPRPLAEAREQLEAERLTVQKQNEIIVDLRQQVANMQASLRASTTTALVLREHIGVALRICLDGRRRIEPGSKARGLLAILCAVLDAAQTSPP